MKQAGSFWARRRAAVEAEAEAEGRAELAHQAEARDAALADKDDSEILEELGLPDPAGMQAGDDFTAFMARDVPEHLRRQALRTLWRSNPVLACVDGLNDYDDDYRAAMLIQEPVKTAYQVGKGMLKHIEAMDRKDKVEAHPQEDEPVADEADTEVALLDAQDTRVSRDHDDIAPDAPTDDFEDGFNAVTEDPAPRRMRFRFEEATL